MLTSRHSHKRTLSHSEISGSKDACTSPELIAACHVLHRNANQAIHLTAYFDQNLSFGNKFLNSLYTPNSIGIQNTVCLLLPASFIEYDSLHDMSSWMTHQFSCWMFFISTFRRFTFVNMICDFSFDKSPLRMSGPSVNRTRDSSVQTRCFTTRLRAH